MDINKSKHNYLGGFAELIRGPVPTQNICICRENVLSSKERKTILAAIKEEDKKLYKKLKKVFENEAN